MFRRRRIAFSDMTSGNIIRQLISFAVPILLGNLFQQLYNAVDAIVVGNFVSKEALGAVGSTGPLINMILSFAMGMFSGAGVVVSRSFGAKERKKLNKSIHTTLTFSLLMGIIFSVVGVVTVEPLLRFMDTPPELLADAAVYLQIYFGGLAALCVYNAGASILNALGNSRAPLFFLVVSCLINVVGDLLFVLAFHWGIAGVAASTVIAEAISVVLVIVALRGNKSDRLLKFHELRIDWETLKDIIGIGLPGAIQGIIVSFSNIIVQAYFNGLGAVAVAGYSVATKLDAFSQLPVGTMAIAVATFVSQNLGAGQVKRARQGTHRSLILGLSVTVVISVVTLIFGKEMMRIFTPDSAVLQSGMEFLWVLAPFQCVLCGTQIVPGALRGAGSTRFPTVACVLAFVVLRQIYLFFITQTNYTITTVALGYPLTWCIAATAIFIYYLRSDWSRFERKA